MSTSTATVSYTHLSYGAQTADPAQAWRFAVAALAYWPTVGLVIAFVAALAALVPRAAAAIAWAVYGALVLLAALGDVLGIPHDVVQATPFWACLLYTSRCV